MATSWKFESSFGHQYQRNRFKYRDKQAPRAINKRLQSASNLHHNLHQRLGMSKPVKRGDSWFIQFRKGAVSKSSSHATSAKAKAWRAQMLADYTAGKLGAVPDVPVSALLERYAREISPRKRGCRWEVIRLQMIARDPLADVRLPELDQPHIAQWRDRRLASKVGLVSSSPTSTPHLRCRTLNDAR
jgi:hypothetical protein